MLRTFGYMIFGGVVFFCAGVWLYYSGVAPQLAPAHFVFRALLATVIVGLYTVCGWAAGLLLALSHAILRRVEKFEENLQNFLDQRLANVLAKIPIGQQGLALADFRKLLWESASEPLSKDEAKSPTLLSSAKLASRFLKRRAVQGMNILFLQDFVEALEAQGQTHVNVATVEKYGREKLLVFALDYLRAPVSLIRIVTMIVAAFLLLLPLGIWLARA